MQLRPSPLPACCVFVQHHGQHAAQLTYCRAPLFKPSVQSCSYPLLSRSAAQSSCSCAPLFQPATYSCICPFISRSAVPSSCSCGLHYQPAAQSCSYPASRSPSSRYQSASFKTNNSKLIVRTDQSTKIWTVLRESVMSCAGGIRTHALHCILKQKNSRVFGFKKLKL